MQDPGLSWTALCARSVCVLPLWDAATVEGRIVGSRSGARPLGQGLSVPPSGAVPGGALAFSVRGSRRAISLQPGLRAPPLPCRLGRLRQRVGTNHPPGIAEDEVPARGRSDDDADGESVTVGLGVGRMSIRRPSRSGGEH